LSEGSEGSDPLVKEWEQTRDVLKTFDDKIHDLRKYGFTFVTGLLAVQGILLPWTPASPTQQPSGIPDEAKLGVLIATILLIIVLRWFDGNYQGYVYGASLRARVIERFVNYELTDQIAVRYQADRLWVAKVVLYAGFTAATIGLGIAILPTHRDWIEYLAIGALFESLLYYFLASPHRLRGSIGQDDWSLDRIRCKANEEVRIMVTNFNTPNSFGRDGVIRWGRNQKTWEIRDHTDTPMYWEEAQHDINIEPGFSYMWSFIPLEIGLVPGVYRIFVNFQRADLNKSTSRELARKLHITR